MKMKRYNGTKNNDDDAREGKIELTFLNPKTNNYENSNVYFRFSFIKDECGKKKQIKPLLFKIHLKEIQEFLLLEMEEKLISVILDILQHMN